MKSRTVTKQFFICILKETEFLAKENNEISSLLINAKVVKTAYTQR